MCVWGGGGGGKHVSGEVARVHHTININATYIFINTPYSKDVKNEWISNSLPPARLNGVHRVALSLLVIKANEMHYFSTSFW